MLQDRDPLSYGYSKGRSSKGYAKCDIDLLALHSRHSPWFCAFHERDWHIRQKAGIVRRLYSAHSNLVVLRKMIRERPSVTAQIVYLHNGDDTYEPRFTSNTQASLPPVFKRLRLEESSGGSLQLADIQHTPLDLQVDNEKQGLAPRDHAVVSLRHFADKIIPSYESYLNKPFVGLETKGFTSLADNMRNLDNWQVTGQSIQTIMDALSFHCKDSAKQILTDIDATLREVRGIDTSEASPIGKVLIEGEIARLRERRAAIDVWSSVVQKKIQTAGTSRGGWNAENTRRDAEYMIRIRDGLTEMYEVRPSLDRARPILKNAREKDSSFLLPSTVAELKELVRYRSPIEGALLGHEDKHSNVIHSQGGQTVDGGLSMILSLSQPANKAGALPGTTENNARKVQAQLITKTDQDYVMSAEMTEHNSRPPVASTDIIHLGDYRVALEPLATCRLSSSCVAAWENLVKAQRVKLETTRAKSAKLLSEVSKWDDDAPEMWLQAKQDEASLEKGLSFAREEIERLWRKHSTAFPSKLDILTKTSKAMDSTYIEAHDMAINAWILHAKLVEKQIEEHAQMNAAEKAAEQSLNELSRARKEFNTSMTSCDSTAERRGTKHEMPDSLSALTERLATLRFDVKPLLQEFIDNTRLCETYGHVGLGGLSKWHEEHDRDLE